MKRLRIAALAVILLVAAFGTGLLIAALNRDSQQPAFVLVDRVAAKIERTITGFTAPETVGPPTEFFPTIFLGLEGRVVNLPRSERVGIGGALTPIGDQVLVLRFDGEPFAVAPDGTTTRPDITMPDNGFAAYLEAIEKPEYADFNHRPDRFRYNDILYHDGPMGPRLLTSYLWWNAEAECFATTVSQLILDAAPKSPSDIVASADDWQLLYRMEPCLPLRGVLASIQGEEAGGRMAFSQDGTKVYLANGDYGWNGFDSDGRHPLSSVPLAQYPEADHGKVMEIDLETGTARRFSSGHRNPQGITLDGQGRLWTVEHGPRGGDELNLIKDGNNYGWPLETYGTDYNGAPLPSVAPEAVGQHDTFVKPVWAWLPSVATSSLAYVEGFDPAWDGDILATSLRGNLLIRLRVDGERLVFAERIEMGRRIRDLVQVSDQLLAAWTDAHEVIFLRPVAGGHGEQFVDLHIENMTASADFKEKMRQTVALCSDCHSFSRDEHRIGPSLAFAAGGPIAGTSFAGYSDALRAASGNWTHDRLVAFLDNPDATWPGTTMPDPGIDDPELLDALANMLEALSKADRQE